MNTIIEAIRDENLFRPFLQDKDGKLLSWSNWFTALRTLYGLPIQNPERLELVRQCTGRDPSKLPPEGFDTALFLIGRRSGKSRIAAIVGAYEAALSGKEKLLAKGEVGMVAIIAPTKKQGRVVKSYLRAIFIETPLLQNEIENETSEGFLLNNGILVEILVGDWRNIRGYTLLACVIDEICFFGLDDESKVRNDTELITAIRPSLATTGGKLICISSPYAKKGWSYKQYKKNFGNNLGKTLVWNCSSRMMNATLPQAVVNEAMEEDLQAAKSEYLGEFRDDVAIWLPREVIESVVVKGRKELLPKSDIKYFSFCDVSGGRSDDAGLAIGHRAEPVKHESGRKVVIDKIQRYKAPHSPYQVIVSMVEELRRYSVRKITGDNYSAEFVKDAFESNGIRYEKSELNKSQLYLELLPMVCSKSVEFLDEEISISQLSSLERRTRSGGKDIVDHPQGGHDDLANAVAGLSFITSKKRPFVGGFATSADRFSLDSMF